LHDDVGRQANFVDHHLNAPSESALVNATLTNTLNAVGDITLAIVHFREAAKVASKSDYDLGGRRTSMTGTLAGFVPPTAVPALTYDGTNRLTSWSGVPLTYDANGNLTGFGSATYTWNARNQLAATSGGGAAFSYDAFGRRVSATVSGVTTPYLYDGQNPAMISSNQLLAGAGLDEIYAQVNSSGTTSYLRDGLNSTVALTNSSAAIVTNVSYSPHGDTASTGTASTSLQYTGRENDGATGLYYYRARYYSPQLERFISEDPTGLGGGTNYYAYVDGNPLSFIDPLGLAAYLNEINATTDSQKALYNWGERYHPSQYNTILVHGSDDGGYSPDTTGPVRVSEEVMAEQLKELPGYDLICRRY
jgi:RHS repeat-associated protein